MVLVQSFCLGNKDYKIVLEKLILQMLIYYYIRNVPWLESYVIRWILMDENKNMESENIREKCRP